MTDKLDTRPSSPSASAYDTEKNAHVSTVHAVDFQDPKDNKVLQRALRKTDYRLIPTLAILYLFSYLDRGSLANASIFGMKEDLHLNAQQYNIVATVFFFTYGAMEVPGGIILTYVRPNLWIAAICFAWGVVMTLHGLVQNYGGAIAVRLALGIAEASFLPSALVLVGNWYPRVQYQTRITAFYIVGVWSGAFSGLLAYAIHGMEGVGGLAAWRWIFILEGLATVVLSSVILFVLPNEPSTAKFLTEEERDAIIASRASEGNDGHPHFEWKYLKDCATDYKVYMCTWLTSAINILIFGFSYQMPAILVQMGYKAEKAQLMTVPIYTAGCFVTLLAGIYSDSKRRRSDMLAIGFSTALIGLVMSYCLPKDRLPGVRYFACFLLMSGGYMALPGSLAWNSNNAESKGKRNMSMAFQLTIASLATSAGTNSYLGKEAPYYPTGFGFSMAMCASSILVVITLVFCLRRENARLDEKEREAYASGGPVDEVALKFRYIY